jgi:ppGpp synthetase/RelA/SpoT-type nucleotidyltranferase
MSLPAIDYQRYFGTSETEAGAPDDAARALPEPTPSSPMRAMPAAPDPASRGASLAALEAEYQQLAPRAARFAAELARQLETMLASAGVVLAMPVQQRVKPWATIAERVARADAAIGAVGALSDLVGVRVVVQFRRDLATVARLLDTHFTVLSREDGEAAPDAVGYPSGHAVVALPDAWLALPTLADLRGWRAEVQLRTTAQHVWAGAVRALDYPDESAMPPRVRRVMARVSTFLETIDLELERALLERTRHGRTPDVLPDVLRDETPAAAPAPAPAPLDAGRLEQVLDELWPPANKRAGEEPYGDLLEDLRNFSVADARTLQPLLARYRDAALAEDARAAHARRTSADAELLPAAERERLARGVYYTHAGLTRWVLGREFGSEFLKYVTQAMQERRPRTPAA